MVVVCANDVGITEFAFIQDQMDGRVVVVDMDPVAHLFTSAVELWFDIAKDVCNLTRDELFDVLVGAVIIRAIADRCLDAKTANPCSDEVV